VTQTQNDTVSMNGW